jgi:hypothetical protein
MEEAVPFCKLVVLTNGNSDSLESPYGKTTNSSANIMVKNTSKVKIFNVRQAK